MTDDNGSRSLVLGVRERYLAAPDRTRNSLTIAVEEAVNDYIQRVRTLDPKDIDALKQALDGSSVIVEQIAAHLDSLEGLTVDPNSIGGHALYALTAKVTSDLRLDPRLIDNEAAQLIIADALYTVGDIADVCSSVHYLGADPVNKDANQLIEEYFAAVPFKPSFHDLKTSVMSVNMILQDWGAAVAYCRSMGIPEEAFLRDGANLFRFSPDALPYVREHQENFPGLELRKVNNGPFVESWLTTAHLGVGAEKVGIEAWKLLLTGYTPKDNAAIPGLNERYTSPLVATALEIQNRRL